MTQSSGRSRSSIVLAVLVLLAMTVLAAPAAAGSDSTRGLELVGADDFGICEQRQRQRWPLTERAWLPVTARAG